MKRKLSNKSCEEKDALNLFDNLFDISLSNAIDKIKKIMLEIKKQSKLIYLSSKISERIEHNLLGAQQIKDSDLKLMSRQRKLSKG